MGNRGIAPPILNLGRFTYGEETRYPLNERQGGLRAGVTVLEKKKSLVPPGFRAMDRPAHSLVTTYTEILGLL